MVDEYYPISKTSKNSFRYYINKNFFDHVNLKKKYYFNCENDYFLEERFIYEEKITEEGGFDLVILGIGDNGHIAYNEPGSEFSSRVRLVELEKITIEQNKKKYSINNNLPKYALTVGIHNIFKAKRILLLVLGESKRDKVKEFIEGPIMKILPVSILKLHENLTVILDEKASSLLDKEIREIIYY